MDSQGPVTISLILPVLNREDRLGERYAIRSVTRIDRRGFGGGIVGDTIKQRFTRLYSRFLTQTRQIQKP